MQNRILGIDVGGTGIKSAIVDIIGGELLTEVLRMPTPQPATPEAIFLAIEETKRQLAHDGPIGMGFPAIVKKGITRSAANVSPQWINYPALEHLQRIAGHPVNVINDADAAGLAEIRFGVGHRFDAHRQGSTLLITLGTGIGSALFVNGQLFPNTELGHIEINGIDAEKQAATVIRERENLSWEVWGRRVNHYLQKIEFLLSPDVVIIGGGVSESSELFFPYISLEATLLAAEMGNDAGIVGAAMSVGLI